MTCALAAGAGCGTGPGVAAGGSGGSDPTTEPTTTAPDPTATTTAPPDSTGLSPIPTADAASGTSAPPTASPPPANTYDPSVTFEWPESAPSSASCEGGRYVGTFECNMEFIPGLPPTPFTGPLTFTLTPSQDGEFLVIDNAHFDAETNGTPFGADLVGEVDCSTGTFQATLDNGVWGTAPFTGTFFGVLDGALDPLTGTLSGTWQLTSGTPSAPQTQPCVGTWSTALQP